MDEQENRFITFFKSPQRYNKLTQAQKETLMGIDNVITKLQNRKKELEKELQHTKPTVTNISKDPDSPLKKRALYLDNNSWLLEYINYRAEQLEPTPKVDWEKRCKEAEQQISKFLDRDAEWADVQTQFESMQQRIKELEEKNAALIKANEDALLNDPYSIPFPSNLLKIVSWNMNGYNAREKDGSLALLMNTYKPNILALQETKASDYTMGLKQYENYHVYYFSSKKPGYSGTAILCKEPPLKHHEGIGIPEFDDEGRVITLEYRRYCVICVYVPTSQSKLCRLDYRLAFNKAFTNYVKELETNTHKPVIITGDMNVGAKYIDVFDPDGMEETTGFSLPERTAFSEMLRTCNLVDSFRELHQKEQAYTWWFDTKFKEADKGMRLDYCLISQSLCTALKDSGIYQNHIGSDHAPVYVELDMTEV